MREVQSYISHRIGWRRTMLCGIESLIFMIRLRYIIFVLQICFFFSFRYSLSLLRAARSHKYVSTRTFIVSKTCQKYFIKYFHGKDSIREKKKKQRDTQQVQNQKFFFCCCFTGETMFNQLRDLEATEKHIENELGFIVKSHDNQFFFCWFFRFHFSVFLFFSFLSILTITNLYIDMFIVHN